MYYDLAFLYIILIIIYYGNSKRGSEADLLIYINLNYPRIFEFLELTMPAIFVVCGSNLTGCKKHKRTSFSYNELVLRQALYVFIKISSFCAFLGVIPCIFRCITLNEESTHSPCCFTPSNCRVVLSNMSIANSPCSKILSIVLLHSF